MLISGFAISSYEHQLHGCWLLVKKGATDAIVELPSTLLPSAAWPDHIDQLLNWVCFRVL